MGAREIPRVHRYDREELYMQNKLHTTETDQLFEAITLLENIEDCYRFFEDICTINEIQSFVQRFQVAKMLRENKIYTQITKETGASTATISRVKRTLDYGADGYDLVLERLKKKDKNEC